MIKQFLCGIILGLIITIASLQYNPHVIQIIGDGFQQAFEQALDCKLSCTLDRINLFSPAIVLSDVTVLPSQNASGWQWHAKKYVMYCSWWHLLLHGTIDLCVEMDDVIAETDFVNGALAIMPHLQKMAVGDPNVPMFVKYINLEKATFITHDRAQNRQMALTWKSKTKKMGAWLRSQINVLDGSCICNEKKYAHSLKGTFSCDVMDDCQKPEFAFKSNCSMIIDTIFKKPMECHIAASWDHDKGSCAIKTNNQNIEIKSISAQFVDNALCADINGNFPLSVFADLFGTTIPLKGDAAFQARAVLGSDQKIDGAIQINALSYNEIMLVPALTCAVHCINNTWDAKIDARCMQDYQLHAQASGDDQHAQMKADIPMDLVRAVCTKYADYPLEADGAFQLTALFDAAKLHADIALKNGFIRLADTYNCITQCTLSADMNYDAKIISLNKMHATLNEGSIYCNNATIRLNDAYNFDALYASIVMDHALINLYKNIDLYLSGALVLSKKGEELPIAKGRMIIDDVEMRGNILSADFIKNITASSSEAPNFDMHCDIAIETKNPIELKTPFLQLNSRAALRLNNTLMNPSLIGSISIDDGILRLPYKPLMISRGTISFDHGQLDNPFIEVVAKNTIKHHEITLQAMGPLQDLHISLFANPDLTETQIASLLIAGSKEESLHTIIPALATQSLKNYFFDSGQSTLKLSNTAKEWLKPLRNVHLVPLFNDQTARGGIRAAFEIEVGDRLRALIQKNFTLTEDTRFEIEYLLSDDLRIRGVRDERRDVNAEVELRWKF